MSHPPSLRNSPFPLPPAEAVPLDALPWPSAVLGSDGHILEVNAAWRAFGAANGGDGDQVGEDYLAHARRARGAHAALGRRAADEVEAVLTGRSTRRSLDYPCHAPGERRWFRLEVTALRRGVLVQHLPVSPEGLARKREPVVVDGFQLLFQRLPLAMWVVDETTLRIRVANEVAERQYGYDPGTLAGVPVTDLFIPAEQSAYLAEAEERRGLAMGPRLWHHRRRDGRVFEVERLAFPVEFDGRPCTLAILADVSVAPQPGAAEAREYALLEALVEGTTDAIFVKDIEGRYLLVNRAGLSALGLALPEVLGRTDADLFPPAVAARLQAEDRVVLSSGQGEILERPLAVAEGTRLERVMKWPCRDPAGGLLGIVGISRAVGGSAPAPSDGGRDVTRLLDLVALQQDLAVATLDQESMMQYIADRVMTVVSGTGAAVLLVRGDRLVFHACSGTAVEAWGESLPMAGSISGLSVRENVALCCDDAGRDPRADHVMAQRLGARSLLTVPLRDERGALGVLLVTHVDPRAFREADRQTLLLTGGLLSAALARAMAFDRHRQLLEERTQALAAVRAIEERFRAAVEAAGVGVFEWDLARERVTWLGEVDRLFGFPPGSYDGRYQTLIGCVHHEDRVGVETALTAALTGHTEYSHANRVVWPDGSIHWLMGRGHFRYDPDDVPAAMSGVVIDITERRAMEMQLLQAQKIEAIGQLAAGIAHEINTPIQFIGDNLAFISDVVGTLTGLLEGLRRDPAAVDRLWAEADGDFLLAEIPRAVSQSREGVDRVGIIVRAMKEFSHPDSSEPVPADLNHAIENATVISHNEWKYAATLTMDLGPELPPVTCHPGEIQRVLLNLIINAAHAITDAGRASPETGRIHVSSRQLGEVVEVRVADNGTGIPEGIRERIFEPFFTTKEVGRGTGQGLALTRDVVVRRHRGSIWFETVPQQGTTFVVRLPLHPVDVLPPGGPA